MASLVPRPSLWCLLVLVVSVCGSVGVEEDEEEVFQWPIHMPTPGHTSLKHNDYRCRASELPHRDNYIVRYEPRADPNIAHHLLVYGCNALSYKLQDSSSWNCKSSTICATFDIPRIIYAWALNASGFQLPSGVGQKVGPSSKINYLVVQIHYGDINGLDLSVLSASPLALILHMTAQRQQRVSGVYLLGSSSIIPPGREDATADTMCKFNGPKTIVPIAFRTHAHVHSTIIVGYVGDGEDRWREIGFRSPQDPQAFYPVTNGDIRVNPGDWLASRCVYNTSNRATSIHMGPDSEDEMCNFYIMYHTENDERPLISNDCWEPAPPDVNYPPLPTLPPSHDSHHHHSPMMGGSDVDDIVTETTQNTQNPTTSSSDVVTLPEGGEEDDYICPSSIPPTNQVPSKCRETTPTNQLPETTPTNQVPEATPTHQLPEGKGNEEQFHLYPVKDWLYNEANSPLIGADTGKLGILGQVTSVAMAADGSVLVLHRGPRLWDFQTFTYTNIFVNAEEGPISTPTVFKFSSVGVLEQVWGAGMFYLPHSITVDHQGHIWITDVAMHQVFKFSGLEATEPSLTLGHKLTPGSKPDYFCKPADVAVSSAGTFYVADGYCNSRVLAYSSNGALKSIFGNYPIDKKMMFIPHSLALSPAQDKLYVADRENKRIVSIEVAGGKVRVFSGDPGLGRVFAVSFSGVGEGGWPLLTVSATDDGESGYGLAVGNAGDIEMLWDVEQKFERVHDLVVDSVNKAVYVAVLDQPTVWKFTFMPVNSSPVSGNHDTTVATEQPLGTTEEPQSTSATEQPKTTTEEPQSTSTTEQPKTTTEHEASSTEQPQDGTKQPQSTTDQPQGTTEEPHSTTSQPQNTTQPTITEQPETDHSTDNSDVTVTTSTTPTVSPIHTTSDTTPEFNSSDNDTGSGSTTTNSLSSDNNDSSSSQDSGGSKDKVDAGSENAETASFDSKSGQKVATPVYHYGLFAAIFAIVGLILVVVIGILKEHRYCRFRPRKIPQSVVESGPKTPRDALHSLLGPSKLGFSRLRTYDSDSEVEEFPIFSRQS